MFVLTFLWVAFIGLVWFIVQLLQKYCDAHRGLQITEKMRITEIQNHLKLKENTRKILEIEKQLNALIRKRLTEIDEKFPMEQSLEEVHGIFVGNVEKALRYTLNMLKTEHHEVKP